MHHHAFTLELSADPVLNCSILIAQHVFEVEAAVQPTSQIRPVLVDAEKNIRHTSIRDIITTLFDAYYQRTGKSELTRDRQSDNIPKCYYLGFKKSGKKSVSSWFGWYEETMIQWRVFRTRIEQNQQVSIGDVPTELLRLNRVLRNRSHIGWSYISIVDFMLLPFLQHVVQVLYSLPALHPHLGELTVNVLIWLEYMQARAEVQRFSAVHRDYSALPVTSLVHATFHVTWLEFTQRYTGPALQLAVSDRRHHHALSTAVTWSSVMAKLGNVVMVYDDDTQGLESLEGVRVESKNRSLVCKYRVDWATLPAELDPSRALGEQKQRLDRKRDQISGLVHVIGAMIRPGDVVVDFCAGSGHLTLVLAQLFPANQFVLLDKNEVSVSLAQKRIRALNLRNIQVVVADVQAVLDGTVPVTCSLGLALHACGALSDLVLDYCLTHRAAYCLVPCCLGAISNWHGGAGIQYPRSALFGHDSGVTLEDYLLLAARADQTACQTHSEAYWRGKHAMGLINCDRNAYATQRGYHTAHLTLQPSSASPKNDVVCGAPSEQARRVDEIFKE